MAKILIVDDDQAVCSMISDTVVRMGHESVCRSNLSEGLREASSGSFDVVFLDVCLPDGSGLDALPSFSSTQSNPEVIIMTGSHDPDGAEAAIRSGAWDYVPKPVTSGNITLTLNRVCRCRDNLRRLGSTREDLKLEGVVGGSRRMKACLDQVAQAARSEADVLITGETGTGKELIARAIHFNSFRAAHDLIVVDCASLPDNLVESALFGHEKGAFTGADRAKTGLVMQADGGTLFLDEVGELSPAMQKNFLRVLQEHCFRPIGATREIRSNFRLIAATNRDLDRMVTEGTFRSDLLFRLRSISIELPPLRERMEDIEGLASFHAARLFERYGIRPKDFSQDFREALKRYHWPGNVRELVNALNMAVSLGFDEPILFAEHLPVNIRVKIARENALRAQGENLRPAPPDPPEAMTVKGPIKFKEYRELILDEACRQYLTDLLTFARGDIKEACRISGLGRTVLYDMLKKYNVSRSGWPMPSR